MMPKTKIFVFCFLCITSAVLFCQSDNWPGYEGGSLHHNASKIGINPTNIGILWKRSFTKIIQVPDAWCYCTPKGNYGLRNLAICNGYLPVVAYDGYNAPSNLSREKIGYITILNSKTGKTLNMIKGPLSDGPRHCCADGADTYRGLQVTHWDPYSNIVYFKTGGDGPGCFAFNGLANSASYRYGAIQNGIGAYAWLDRSPTNISEVIPNTGSNSTSFFEMDSDMPIMCTMSGTHSITANQLFSHKMTGVSLGVKYNNRFHNYTQLKTFAKYGGIITGNRRLFAMGPDEIISDYAGKGLKIWAYDITWTDEFPHQWDTIKDFDVIRLDTAFQYTLKSTGDVGETTWNTVTESYRERDGYYQNKSWLIDGKGIWIAWKPDTISNVQLVYCDENKIEKFDLGIGSKAYGYLLWPHISVCETGNKKYIVYFYSSISYGSKISVFNATDKKVEWTYDISANHVGIGAAKQCYLDKTKMLVAGKYAYVGWMDMTKPTAQLSVLGFDIIQSSAIPVMKQFSIGFESNLFPQSHVTDMAASEGILYALITQTDSMDTGKPLPWVDGSSKWQSQHVIAFSENPDLVPPSKPMNCKAIEINTTFLTLQWKPSIDETAVFYKIFQDGKMIMETQDTSFKVIALTDEQTYTFVIEPTDLAGNVGERDSVIVTTGYFPVEPPIDTTSSKENHYRKIQLYPNPATEKVCLVSDNSIKKASITNVVGQVMIEIDNLNQSTVDINIGSLPQGLYLMKLYLTSGEIELIKFIKN